ncbi:hypothetical protein Poli38472_003975 [Pythium oligandrum]|uniref:phosphatidylinositol 3-kinase n=1 Tax=Pythium oligandrum TaxID=41045 RepID=A0A8K1FJM2_PYTOL|nr:hypothetical protein Poli38472_003975 [Pythium oligandrum]|eukprot:TMW66210.1 hypothetical protein Poli38472_003975 [Pythium oligandrum]
MLRTFVPEQMAHFSVLKSSQSSVTSSSSSHGGVSSAYAMYEMHDALAVSMVSSSTSSTVDPSLDLPSFDELNPYAKAGAQSSHRETDRRWQPVPDLYHSKESAFFRRSVKQILKKVHQEISPGELEVRANTPEFKIHEDDWVAHNEKNQFALITPLKTVARIPVSLIMSDHIAARTTHENDISGYLRKRGERNRSYKRRYMELNGHVLSYYKKKPEKNGIPLSRVDKKAYERGSIDLDRVSSIQPIDLKSEPYGIHLVTTSRTWVISAESEQDYHRWLKSLCSVVAFSAVHVTFKRMLLLQEVSAKAVNDVRMVIATGDTVGEIVEHIFNCYKLKLDAAPLRAYDPSKYVLKVTGYRDYMIDRFRVMNEYMHVRECLLTKKTLRLTVVHESVIQETAMRSLNIRSDILSNQLLGDFSTEGERSSLHMTALGDEWERQSLIGAAPSGTMREPFAIKIRRVLNIPRFTCVRKRTHDDSSFERRPLTTTSVIVRIELFNGGELLEGCQYETSDVRLKAQRNDLLCAEWDEPVWHHFNLDVCEIVRTMRIQVSVIGIRRIIGNKEVDGREETILVTGINAFDVEGLLKQGTQYVSMYNNLHSCIQGPVPHIVLPEEPILHSEFPRFGSSVKFDWSDTDVAQNMQRMARRTVVGSSTKSHMVRKVGWLQKVGYSRWTKWRRRWFEVDQELCTLSYAEDENSAKKHIPLRNCSIMVADDMNEKYTTAPVNKGTRKERQTYCFKVRPQHSSRDYIISAETKQEREEWMLAIHTVSKGDPDNQETPRMFGTVFSKDEDYSRLFGDGSRASDNNADEADGRNILEGFAQDRRDSLAVTSDTSSSLKDTTIAELRRVILMDPLFRLGPFQKSQMWAHREEFVEIPAALPRILSCVDWTDREEVEEALELLPRWAVPEHPAAYIELLNGEFSNPSVRAFAVEKISHMRDTTFSYFLPQLVQALKFENHHTSPLAMMLIERAIKNPNQIGFDLFWSMKVESHNPQYRELYGTILNVYLDVCSHKMKAILKLQDKLFAADGMFDRICQSVKAKKKEGSEEMKRAMREGLEALNEILPSSFQLPIDPRIEVGKIIVSKCRVMDSAKKPLWLVFENAEEGGDPVSVMFKAGDDVRQDCLTLQLIRLMDEMWRDEGLDLAMEPYRCVATSPMTGILEIVQNSVTTAEVHKRVGILGAFKDPSFSDWIRANNSDRRSHRNAVDLFSRSCAGYCVATCVLGIGDRHNDNIMICATGRYFHIDFGHFLGHFKYQMGLKRERSPFVFTKEMAHVLGGTESAEFTKFVETACMAYNVLRKHMHLLVSLLLLMVPADMPELTGRDDINHLVTTLAPELSEDQARASFTDAIHFCLDDKFKRIDNTIHIFAHLFS